MPDLITGGIDYVRTVDAAPRRICHNVIVALDRSRELTNGHPGTLAHYINALSLMWIGGLRAFPPISCQASATLY